MYNVRGLRIALYFMCMRFYSYYQKRIVTLTMGWMLATNNG